MTSRVKFSATSQRTSLSTEHSTSLLSRRASNSLMARSARQCPHPETESPPKATSTRCQRVSCPSRSSNRWQRWKRRDSLKPLRVVRPCSSSKWRLSRRRPSSLSTRPFRAQRRPQRRTCCSRTSTLSSLAMLTLTWPDFVPHSSLSIIRTSGLSTQRSSRVYSPE